MLEVTDDKILPKAERKRLQLEHAPYKSREAKLVKLADKISNILAIADSPAPRLDRGAKTGIRAMGA